MNILHQIIADKKKDLVLLKQHISIKDLESSIYFQRPTISLSKNIRASNQPMVIAEFKRRSPSKPNINIAANINTVPIDYASAGAAALSILTNTHYFGGKDSDIINTRDKVNIPILRKEFIIDEYQIIEAKSIGADLILLIAEVLSAEECKQLASFAKSLGLEVLLEMHSAEQLNKINDYVDLVGVNNRNLENFVTTIDTSLKLLDRLPKEKIKVSESGIDHPSQVAQLYAAGYEAFLIGENFMKHGHPGEACKEFIDAIKVNK
jgi:indole-3-glycerol phosphate synthase